MTSWRTRLKGTATSWLAGEPVLREWPLVTSWRACLKGTATPWLAGEPVLRGWPPRDYLASLFKRDGHPMTSWRTCLKGTAYLEGVSERFRQGWEWMREPGEFIRALTRDDNLPVKKLRDLPTPRAGNKASPTISHHTMVISSHGNTHFTHAPVTSTIS